MVLVPNSRHHEIAYMEKAAYLDYGGCDYGECDYGGFYSECDPNPNPYPSPYPSP